MINPKTVSQLYASVESAPFDVDARQLLGGYLTGGGDPRGYLIQEQCKPEAEQDPELITALLTEHGRQWAAEDLGIKESDIPASATFEFYQGFAWLPVQVEFANFQAALQSLSIDVVSQGVTHALMQGEILDVPVNITKKVVLFVPGKEVHVSEVVHILRHNLRLNVNVDQIWEFCALGMAYPQAAGKYAIAAPGYYCKWNSDPSLLFMSYHKASSKLELYLCDRRHPLSDYNCFLATRDWLIR